MANLLSNSHRIVLNCLRASMQSSQLNESDTLENKRFRLIGKKTDTQMIIILSGKSSK